MDVWKHSRLSARKFGGDPADYAEIHGFLDSSKLFCYHIKHRLLLHNLYGVELAMQLFGDFIQNAAGETVLVRDVAAAHCREDLDGRVPTLYDWLRNSPELEDFISADPGSGQVSDPPSDSDDAAGMPPDSGDPEIDEFARRAYRRTGLRSALAIAYSDFGVYLIERFFGAERATRFAASVVQPQWKIKDFLERFQFSEEWQHSPQTREIAWLKADSRRKISDLDRRNLSGDANPKATGDGSVRITRVSREF
ncbi:MAG: hypothetical protein NXI24_15730 [bacterium]|nr:hypothetical protein [bacterium]